MLQPRPVPSRRVLWKNEAEWGLLEGKGRENVLNRLREIFGGEREHGEAEFMEPLEILSVDGREVKPRKLKN